MEVSVGSTDTLQTPLNPVSVPREDSLDVFFKFTDLKQEKVLRSKRKLLLSSQRILAEIITGRELLLRTAETELPGDSGIVTRIVKLVCAGPNAAIHLRAHSLSPGDIFPVSYDI